MVNHDTLSNDLYCSALTEYRVIAVNHLRGWFNSIHFWSSEYVVTDRSAASPSLCSSVYYQLPVWLGFDAMDARAEAGAMIHSAVRASS